MFSLFLSHHAFSQDVQRCKAMASAKHLSRQISINYGQSFPEPSVNRELEIDEMQSSGVEMAKGFTKLAYINISIYYKVDTSISFVKFNDGLLCAWPNGFGILGGYTRPQIFINNTSVIGTCHDNIIVWHENQHAKNSRDAIGMTVPDMERELMSLENTPILAGYDQEQLKNEIGQQVMQITKDVEDIAFERAHQNDMLLDSPENYRHQFDRCPQGE